jgi:uncharacterized coiled-coil DUF342 family protein
MNPLAKYEKTYKELCAKRDAVNAEVAPLQAKLAEANARAQEAQAEANALAMEIQEKRGGEQWLFLKKEIRMLADALKTKPKA